MKGFKRVGAVMCSLLWYASGAMAESVVGQWVTIDDKQDIEKSIVELQVNSKDELEGTIVKVLDSNAETTHCTDCPGDLKGQPLEGLRFMWGLTAKDSGDWRGGEILDPKTGKVYRARLALSDDAETLTVRGFVGLALFGRSQTWRRLSGPKATPDD